MLIVARHGRTAANAAGLLLGRADPPLDDEGRAQAAALASVLATTPEPWRVLASPLQRTRATAEVIAARLGVEVELDERWIELDYGELDGRPASEVPAATWRRWRADVDFAPPGGESMRALGERVRGACRELHESACEAGADGGTTIAVSHVSPIKAAVAWALDVGDELAWRLFVAPASRTGIRIGPRGVALTGFNLVDHLSELHSPR
jgi:broad specificity phosphatase PhoE